MDDDDHKTWIEARDLRKRHLNDGVWIPLRSQETLLCEGDHGNPGFRDEYLGAVSMAVPFAQRAAAFGLRWTDFGLRGDHAPCVEDDGEYNACDVERHEGIEGFRIVIEQAGTEIEPRRWRLHPDFVLGLNLLREGNHWLAINEGYAIAVRLRADERGAVALEVKSEFLKDYLTARRMGLYVNTYRQRTLVLDEIPRFGWATSKVEEIDGFDRWTGTISPIHRGGHLFGDKIAITHIDRTDVDEGHDVPTMGLPKDESVRVSVQTLEHRGAKVFRVDGELWRSEWVEPGNVSTRVRGDAVVTQVPFIVDPVGSRRAAGDLSEDRWLWFRPEAIRNQLAKRGSKLTWYTRDTGEITCSHGWGVHFGLNKIGLVTVFAKDIAALPEWQQRIWSADSVTPDGGVSEELMAAQVHARPAETVAAETKLATSIENLNTAWKAAYGTGLIEASQNSALLPAINRFAACSTPDLVRLAKDVTRVTIESIRKDILWQIVPPAKGAKPGSMKGLQAVIATRVGEEKAREATAHLFAVYDLRLKDAHLSSTGPDEELSRLGIDTTAPPVDQARELIHAVAVALAQCASIVSSEE
jgi:hypothetical protein